MNRKKLWYLIGIGVFVLIMMIIISDIIAVGERLGMINDYIEYVFYIISGLLVYILILNPVRVILFAPTFSVSSILEEDKKRHKLYKNAAKVMIRNNILTTEDKTLLKDNMKDSDELKKSLQIVYNRTIKGELNKIIINNAKTSLVTTAISQNGTLDFISVLTINIRLIKQLVEACGFRPSYANLVKLSINILATSLIAEGLEDLEINEIIPTKFTETIADIPFVRGASSSILQGISNGLLTARVGIVTRRYLFNDNKEITKQEIKRLSYKESVKMLPSIVKESSAFLPKSMANIFTSIFNFKNKSKRKSTVKELT